MLRLSLKGVLAHKVRLALTAMAIVLGVAFVSGTYVFTDSIRSSFDDLFSDVNAGVDIYVRGVSEFGFNATLIDEAIVEEVREIPGTRTVAPSVDGIAQIVKLAPCEEGSDADPTKDCPLGGGGPPTLGFSYVPEGESLTPLSVTEGDWPRSGSDVAIDSFVAEANDLAVGDEVDVILPSGVERFTISGIATFGGADNLLGATLAVFDYETAQRIFDAEGRVSSIAIVLEPGLDPSIALAQISSILPEGVEAITGEEQTEDELEEVDQGVGFINTILLVIAGVAVFVGAFLIQNTFRIIVAQRTRELALLRAVGATSRQVIRMVAVEAVIVGIAASIIGIGVGVLLAMVLRAAFAAFGFAIPSQAMVIAPRTIVVGLLVGVVVTTIAALIPARKASKVPPVAAMRDVVTPPRSLARRISAGIGVTALGLVLLAVGLLADIDNRIALVGLGAFVTFVGVSVLAPLVARGFARVAGSPLPRVYGVVGRLAQENAMRRPRRTAATASALMIGVALVTVIAVFSASAKAGVADIFRESFATDFQVRLAGFADPSTTGLSPALTEDLRRLPELQTVVRDRSGLFRFEDGGSDQFLIAVDGPFSEVVKVDDAEGSMAAIAPGTAALAKDNATALGLGVGDTLSIQVPSLEFVDLEVVAIFDDTSVGVPVVIDLETFDRHIDFDLDRFIYIQVAAGVDLASARAAIEVVTDEYANATLTDTEELIGEIEAQIDGVLNLIVVLLGFAIVIALLGIVNTLALSISERKRELGLLRAVGMQRRQVRRMIRWEAVLIAAFGGALGLAVGIVLGAAVVTAVGQGLKLAVPFGQLLIYLAMAAIGGIVAAIVPARRGSKLDILEAIAYE